MKNTYFLMTLLLCFAGKISFAQITSYSINQVITGPGNLVFDIDNDSDSDYNFDIIALPNGTLAARVNPVGPSKILDNSTFGYPDALDMNDAVTGYFHSNVGVLGTFTNAGQFNGAGAKYLGIKLNAGGYDYLGWILLKCSYSRDTLTIISCGYQTLPDEPINAGQTIATGLGGIALPGTAPVTAYPNPCNQTLYIGNKQQQQVIYTLYTTGGKEVLTGCGDALYVSTLPSGVYILKTEAPGTIPRLQQIAVVH